MYLVFWVLFRTKNQVHNYQPPIPSQELINIAETQEWPNILPSGPSEWWIVVVPGLLISNRPLLSLPSTLVILFREKAGEIHLDSPRCRPNVENYLSTATFPFYLHTEIIWGTFKTLNKHPSHTPTMHIIISKGWEGPVTYTFQSVQYGPRWSQDWYLLCWIAPLDFEWLLP